MDITENLKIIAVAHKKANKITMSCENEKHLETAFAYIKNLKKLCASLKSVNPHEAAYIKNVEQSVDSTLKLKRKSLR
jgi:hypothetical protein